MVALIEGTRAPEIKRLALDGEQYSLREILRTNKYAVLGFFKVSCPVCQLAFPYLERLHQAHPDLPVLGISQDDSDATSAFVRMYGLSFPVLLDEALQNTVDYELTNVPSIFLIGQDGSIQQTIVGFVKQDMERLNSLVTSDKSLHTGPLFTDADEVPEFRPG